MEEPELLEWIDQYLMGTISPVRKKELEELMASDPGVAELVRDSKEAFKVLQSEHNRLLREKLRAIDKDENQRSVFLPKWILMMLLCLVILVGGWYWASQYYSNQAIAIRYFKMTSTIEEGVSLSPEMKTTWEQANNAFNKEEYDLAFNLYNSFIETDDHPLANHARWNILLTDLVMHGQTDQWKKGLAAFAIEAPPLFNASAKELSALLQSRWYKVVAHFTQVDITGLKPRLI